MSLQIYNTLSRQKERFIPLEEGRVSFYVCGPTVYNYIHIGNARSAVAFDVIRRYLLYKGYDVNYVSNFTDVDDKIIQAAQEEGVSPKALADKYIQAFQEDTRAINVLEATSHPRVMDYIPEIIAFVQGLVEEDHAYVVDGNVYFRARSFPEYGELSNRTLDQLRSGASERVSLEEQEEKEDPVDFVLWKKAKAGEIYWESPWGAGRPGWHIECSVMSREKLGDTLDIHGGGQDLEFPHHENEIAQSECHNHATFANYWMHNGFVTMGQDAEKMSKSLGNFVLLRDLLEEVEPEVVRYLLSTVHYRRPLNFTEQALEEAKQQVSRLREVLRRLEGAIKEAEDLIQAPEVSLKPFEEGFELAMDDDFNVANAMTVIFDLVRTINLYLEEEDRDRTLLEAYRLLLTGFLEVIGLDLLQEEESLAADIQQLIAERNDARADRNFQRADEIRDLLKEQGILLDDTPTGTTWKRG